MSLILRFVLGVPGLVGWLYVVLFGLDCRYYGLLFVDSKVAWIWI